MRIYDLDIFRSDFRFVITDEDKRTFFVFYNDQDLTVNCSCERAGQCAHTSFIYEILRNEKKETTLSFLQDNMEANSQAVTESTVERMRDAFAREFNLANGIIQYPERRNPLGWEGVVPGWRGKVRVVEIPNRENTFAIYETNGDKYSTVEGISVLQCNHKDCQNPEREVFCKHEAALREALFAWRAGGFLPKAQAPKFKKETTPGTMVEKAEPVTQIVKSGKRTITIPPGFDGNWTVGMDFVSGAIWNTSENDEINRRVREQFEQQAREYFSGMLQGTSTATSGNYTFDFAKFEKDVNKAKKLLEETEEPKPQKPPKPRTRFTDLEL